MRFINQAIFAVLLILIGPCTAEAGPLLKPADVTVGKNLETFATVVLGERAPEGDLEITLTSSDPNLLLLAKTPEATGERSITLKVKGRFSESPDFWLQALEGSGQVTYTASAPGYETGTGKVTLTPSAIVMTGPGGIRNPAFTTTPRGWPSKLMFHVVRLDSSLNYAETQYLRGGLSVDVEVGSSDASVGKVVPATVTMAAATHTAGAEFRPKASGTVTLTARTPPGFSALANARPLTATVQMPGLAVADDMRIGRNLQIQGALSLGEPAPEGGIVVTLTSSDAGKLLLSANAHEKGQPKIDITIPSGGVSTTYFLHALDSTGTATHTATAPGYLSRTGTLGFAPSGVIISTKDHGPPDEAEVFRPDSAGEKRNKFVARLSEGERTPVILYTALLDPKTLRSADITVQALRGGLSLSLDLTNTDPKVGTVETRVTFEGGSDHVIFPFSPRAAGETLISVVTPEGFATPTNSTELLAIVR
jgi:hypothetical protein